MRLSVLAPGKANLCLFLGGTRKDGRHELVTVFESLSVADELELTSLPRGSADEVHCPGVEGPNLVTRALGLLREGGWRGPPVRVTIRKRVPVAAGMGGGSADAAALLRLARSLAGGEATMLREVAAALGSDVPSQLDPGLWLGSGAGDELDPLPALGPHALVIVPLPHALSTAAVYAEADRLGLGRPQGELAGLREELAGGLVPGGRLRDALAINDLEPASVSLCPAVGAALEHVRQAGCGTALVCGSGPTVAGLLWGAEAEAAADAAAAELSVRYPRAQAAVPVRREDAEPREIHPVRHN